MTGFARVLGDFVAEERAHVFTDEQLQRACDALTDGIGVGLAGAGQQSFANAVAAFALDESGRHPVIGLGRPLPMGSAALLNGLAIHALDFDDTAHPAYAHPTAVLLSSLFGADALAGAIDGQRALTAYLIGLEVLNGLGGVLNPQHYGAGFHTTATLGTFAATATVACALELDAATAQTAFSIAASMASGVRANFGTMTKPLHAGLAARNGLEAVRLALSEFTAHDDAVGAKYGFLAATGAAADVAASSLAERLGRPWTIDTDIGLAIKPYPSCGATHPGIEAAAQLHGSVVPRDIRSVTVLVNALSPTILVYPRPQTGLEGKFSLEHCIAAALTRGELGLSDFEDEQVATIVSGDLIGKIESRVGDEVRDSSEFATIVEVVTTDGSVLKEFVPLARGKRDRWPSESDLWTKFSSSAAWAGWGDVTSQWSAARALLDGGTIRELARANTEVPRAVQPGALLDAVR